MDTKLDTVADSHRQPILTYRSLRRDWLFMLCIALVYLAGAVPNIHLPGIYYDEVLQVLPAMDAVGYDLNPDYVIMPGTVLGLGDFRLPVMTTSYLGALESFIFVPIFVLFPPTVTVVRATFIVLGLISVLLTFIWARQLFGSWAALAAGLLLATDTSYIFFTRVDNGPVNTMMLIKLGLLIAFTAWWQTGNRIWFFLGAFLTGVGIYDKANFLWLIAGGGFAVLVFALPQIWQRLRRRWDLLAGGVLAGILGMSPFLAYVILSGGGPLRSFLSSFNSTAFNVDNSDFLSNLGTRWHSFVNIVNGYEPLRVYLTSFTGVQVSYQTLPSLQPWILFLALVGPPLLYIVYRKKLDGYLRFILGLWLAQAIILVMSTFTPTNYSSHHLVMLYPFQQVVVVAAAWIFLRNFNSRLLRGIVMSILGLTIALNIVITTHNHHLLTETEGVGMWSAAIYELNDYLLDLGKPVKCMDWGICHNLQMLSLGQLETADLWSQFLYKLDDPAPMISLLEESNVFVFHSPQHTGVYTIAAEDFPRQTLFETAESLGMTLKQLAVINQVRGDSLYELYTVETAET